MILNCFVENLCENSTVTSSLLQSCNFVLLLGFIDASVYVRTFRRFVYTHYLQLVYASWLLYNLYTLHPSFTSCVRVVAALWFVYTNPYVLTDSMQRFVYTHYLQAVYASQLLYNLFTPIYMCWRIASEDLCTPIIFKLYMRRSYSIIRVQQSTCFAG